MNFLNLAVGLLLSAAVGIAAPAPAAPVPSPSIGGVEISQSTLADLFKFGLKSKGAPIDDDDLVSRQLGWSRNDVTGGKCDDIILIFARGTFEPGNMGWIVGGSFAEELERRELGRVIVQGVEPYDASVLGYLVGGEQKGIDSMASLIERAARQCPTGKIVISGYSQGAQVAHKGAAKISSTLHANVGGVVVFGDPMMGQPFPGTINRNVKTFCRTGDLICFGIPLPIGSHLEYGGDAAAAATYVAGIL